MTNPISDDNLRLIAEEFRLQIKAYAYTPVPETHNAYAYAQSRFHRAANPDRVIGLLDEVERLRAALTEAGLELEALGSVTVLNRVNVALKGNRHD